MADGTDLSATLNRHASRVKLAVFSYSISSLARRLRTPRILPQLEKGGGRDGRCNAEEPTGRYAAYAERTITVENELAITLGDGALCRRLGRRREPNEARPGKPGSRQPTEVGQGQVGRMPGLPVKIAVTG
jgi:hypothetical protein